MGYNAKKAAQTIAYFTLKSGGDRLNVLKAVKLVYLADRESISWYGFPIQDEDRYSMPHGPVNSQTYAHISGDVDGTLDGWNDYIRDDRNHCVSIANLNLTVDALDELSDADIEVLDAVWNRFGDMGAFQIRDWTHDRANVPEWDNPNGSSWLISLDRIMECLNIPDHKEQAQLVREYSQVNDFLKAI